jgi:predicted lactoylglutathione lyase
MIGYTMVGTKDLKRSAEFFDKVLGILGAKRMMDEETFIVWSVTPDQPAFSVCLPHDGNEASVGNGVMTAFNAMSPEQVNEVYNCALENGGRDEGAPGSVHRISILDISAIRTVINLPLLILQANLVNNQI